MGSVRGVAAVKLRDYAPLRQIRRTFGVLGWVDAIGERQIVSQRIVTLAPAAGVDLVAEGRVEQFSAVAPGINEAENRIVAIGAEVRVAAADVDPQQCCQALRAHRAGVVLPEAVLEHGRQVGDTVVNFLEAAEPRCEAVDLSMDKGHVDDQRQIGS